MPHLQPDSVDDLIQRSGSRNGSPRDSSIPQHRSATKIQHSPTPLLLSATTREETVQLAHSPTCTTSAWFWTGVSPARLSVRLVLQDGWSNQTDRWEQRAASCCLGEICHGQTKFVFGNSMAPLAWGLVDRSNQAGGWQDHGNGCLGERWTGVVQRHIRLSLGNTLS